MAGFLGRFLHTLDPKGRISLPAQFRRGRESDPFVLIQTQPEALTLYPDDAWGSVQEDLLEYMKRQPEHRHKVLRITADAVEVVPDKQGRILIPERMRQAAGLTTEAWVVGAINKIQIWDPARFEAATTDETDDDAFDQHMKSVLV
ncbi:MAG: cell division/cell wall cluster transcriptional repressor MraZ [Gemmatimonadota bacterium]|nr:cell division/cell wall cluster transcriptional repressor MraZ [Gemmatimonadota bacterium]